MVCSAMVSAATGTPDRPRRVASGPLAAMPSSASLAGATTGVAIGGGVLQGALQHLGAGQRHLGLAKARSPDSVGSAISVSTSPVQTACQSAQRKQSATGAASRRGT